MAPSDLEAGLRPRFFGGARPPHPPPPKAKRKVTVDPEIAAEDARRALASALESRLAALHAHAKAQTALASIQLLVVIAFALFLTLASALFVAPQMRRVSASAEALATASVPVRDAAGHLRNATAHVGGVVQGAASTVSGLLRSLRSEQGDGGGVGKEDEEGKEGGWVERAARALGGLLAPGEEGEGAAAVADVLAGTGRDAMAAIRGAVLGGG